MSSKTDVFFEETSPGEVLDPQEEFHESDSFNSSLQGNVRAIPPTELCHVLSQSLLKANLEALLETHPILVN